MCSLMGFQMRALGVNLVAIRKRTPVRPLFIFILNTTGLRGHGRPLTLFRHSTGNYLSISGSSIQSGHSSSNRISIGHIYGGQRDGGERDQPRGHGGHIRRSEIGEVFYSHYGTTRMTVICADNCRITIMMASVG